MAPRHAKSPCCGAPVRRRGGRRRQCIQCKRTWSIRRKKCGRPRTRHTDALLKRILLDGHTLAQEARNFRVQTVSIAARCAVALRTFVASPAPPLPQGPYVLVVDGVYFKFGRKEWVSYQMAVKPINSHRMYFLDPVLIQGRETITAWKQAVARIPKETKKQIQGLVSDGLRGFQSLAAEHGWIHQRCHFHLLASLVRGRYRTKGSGVRDDILKAVRVMLADEPPAKRARARRALTRYIAHPKCPAYVRKHILEFLAREQDFRAYLSHPKLHLPTTTNAMESTGKLVRKATRTARTPESLKLRATAFLRLKKSVVCNGSDAQD